jgi:hypothetical protein
MDTSENITSFRAHSSEDELARLNRITGLQFHAVPESLLGRQEDWEAFAESMLGIAIETWRRESR